MRERTIPKKYVKLNKTYKQKYLQPADSIISASPRQSIFTCIH